MCALGAVLWGACSRPSTATRDGNEREVPGSSEPILPIPLDPVEEPALVALGEALFFSPIVSEDAQVSCGSCHFRDRGMADGRAHSELPGRPATFTNSSSLFNVRYFYKIGWFAQNDSLEAHLDGLIKSPKLMGSSWGSVESRLVVSSKWRAAFGAVFSDGVNASNAKRALLAYERSLTTPNAPFDRWLRGDGSAITAEALHGYSLFKSYGCVSCHQGLAVGANMLETFGVMRDYFSDHPIQSDADLGRFNTTHRVEDRHVFRVPSLRNVSLSAPYFHDGSAPTLERAVGVMARYQLGRELDASDVQAIVAFLNSLTGEYRGRPL